MIPDTARLRATIGTGHADDDTASIDIGNVDAKQEKLNPRLLNRFQISQTRRRSATVTN